MSSPATPAAAVPSAPAELPPAYYLPLGDGRFDPTDATTSPWDAAAQHGGPPTALLATCLDDAFGRLAMRVARISMDFLGPVPRTALRVETRLVRPGRRTQLSEATMWAGDRPVATARVWHLAATGAEPPDANGADNDGADKDRAGGTDGGGGSSQVRVPADLPEPQPQRFFGGDGSWGYGRATEWRMVSGGFGRTTGAGDVWTRLRIPLIAGRPLDGLARFTVIADSANGVSAPKSMRDWWFIPPGVTMHLHRYPVGEWVRLRAASDPGEDGIGLTEGTLSDAVGRCGTVTQALLVAPR
jgi:Thioesterase-like superfamily